jgi:hypothetical protein
MERFIHNENLKLYRKAWAETSDEDKRRMLRELIRQEEEKDVPGAGTSKPSP